MSYATCPLAGVKVKPELGLAVPLLLYFERDQLDKIRLVAKQYFNTLGRRLTGHVAGGARRSEDTSDALEELLRLSLGSVPNEWSRPEERHVGALTWISALKGETADGETRAFGRIVASASERPFDQGNEDDKGLLKHVKAIALPREGSIVVTGHTHHPKDIHIARDDGSSFRYLSSGCFADVLCRPRLWATNEHANSTNEEDKKRGERERDQCLVILRNALGYTGDAPIPALREFLAEKPHYVKLSVPGEDVSGELISL